MILKVKSIRHDSPVNMEFEQDTTIAAAAEDVAIRLGYNVGDIFEFMNERREVYDGSKTLSKVGLQTGDYVELLMTGSNV